jgi:hypothetical protein
MCIYYVHTHTQTYTHRYDAAHSVTFLDNHDTAGELKDRFGTLDQILMGYAVIITHPSLPCIFWQDWQSKIQDQIGSVLYNRSCLLL